MKAITIIFNILIPKAINNKTGNNNKNQYLILYALKTMIGNTNKNKNNKNNI